MLGERMLDLFGVRQIGGRVHRTQLQYLWNHDLAQLWWKMPLGVEARASQPNSVRMNRHIAVF
jgi:hypothetical protein